ncbi:MAG: alpha-amylase family glycosyl hydrolase [Crocinitomicaceae bacterium]
MSQVLDVSPAFPTVNDVVTITYKANEGNGALNGISPVYGHFGLITSASTSPSNWQFVQGTWGVAYPPTAMTQIGPNLFQITIDIDVFFGYPAGTNVLQLAMVFRNTDGSIVGRDSDGSDIFYDIYPTGAGLLSKFFAPTNNPIVNSGDPINLVGKSNQNADLTITDNGTTIQSAINTQTILHTISANVAGQHVVKLTAITGSETVMDSFNYLVTPANTIVDAPMGTKNGLNRIDSATVRLQLYAPQKEHIYVVGDFNNWQPDLAYQMNQSVDGNTFWIEIGGLSPNEKYGYQYLIDGVLKVADPLSELVADPSNDGYIPAVTYPNPYVYPTGLTTGILTQFETQPAAFSWQNDSYTRPAKKDLMIYELLVRDFIAKHDYNTLSDTLDYLANLGINAIELMPISEFEGNESWGYNPSFHMALDKYYGTPEHFKAFVDKCHSLGIAVIMDIALNHVYGQNPMVQMYWDAANNQPALNSPWFNAVCPHPPYCWGNDFNHEGQPTKDYVFQVTKYWLDQFHIDGYRFDYTKGFVNSTANYSTTRINILKEYADSLWVQNPEAYVILEHWADNNEEKELSNYGMMLWGNLNYEYLQAIKGYSSNLAYGVYTNRGWNNPHLVTYIESHDEERGLYEALNFGNSTNPAHNVKALNIALQRAQTAAVILISTPGPKMIWQFGELGYDYSINYICRICNKPIRWDYFDNNYRKQVYQVYAAMLNLRNNYPAFQSLNFQYFLGSNVKRIILQDPTMDALVIGNFNVVATPATAGFPSSGTWYEYFTGDSIEVTNTNMQLNLEPSEYRVYTNSRIPQPVVLSTVSLENLALENYALELFPVPANESLSFVTNGGNGNNSIAIIDRSGRIVFEHSFKSELMEWYEEAIDISNLQSGSYFFRLSNASGTVTKKFTKSN